MNFTQTCSSSDGCQDDTAACWDNGTGGPEIVPVNVILALELDVVSVEPDELEDT